MRNMEREIKFRAWNVVMKRMSFGNDLIRAGFQFNTKGCLVVANMVDGKDVDEILMQCTGLKDKNGVEIYENDILEREVDFDMTKKEHNGVKCPPRIRHLCKWVDESVSFVFGVINAEYPFNASIFIGHIWEYEIIGNIYENPELLKEIK